MLGHLKGKLTNLGVKLLVSSLGFVASLNFYSQDLLKTYSLFPKAFAEEVAPISEGWDSYLNRPDILKAPAKAQNLAFDWKFLKQAHFAFVAQLLVTYPKDTQIYFLARDSELLFDTARLVTEGTEDFKRVHLINVSRTNMRDPNLRDYLSQNGISESTLRSGQKVLFVDTGFTGTIPRVISELFPEELRSSLKTHLIVSSSADHPSSRSFLVHLNPAVNEVAPSSLHGTILSYENIEKYFDRSLRYANFSGTYHPLSLYQGSSDGRVSKSMSLMYMSDLKATWQDPTVQQHFFEIKDQLVKVKGYLTDGSSRSVVNLKALILENSKVLEKGRLLEAQIRDFFDANINADLKISLRLQDLGFVPVLKPTTAGFSKKKEMIKMFPEWSAILEDPEIEIPKAVQEGRWVLVGSMIDANVDDEMNRLLLESLFDSRATGIKKSMQIKFIEKTDSWNLQRIAVLLLKPSRTGMGDLFVPIVQRGDYSVLMALAQNIFIYPHTEHLKEPLKLLIERADSVILRNLAQSVFSKPHTAKMKDLIQMALLKSDKVALDYFIEYTFSQPHTREMYDLLRIVIEIAERPSLEMLYLKRFHNQASKFPVESILKAAIKIEDQEVRKDFLEKEFNKLSLSSNTAKKGLSMSETVKPGICSQIFMP